MTFESGISGLSGLTGESGRWRPLGANMNGRYGEGPSKFRRL